MRSEKLAIICYDSFYRLYKFRNANQGVTVCDVCAFAHDLYCVPDCA